MDRHPDDLTTTEDLALLDSARAGDRLAFGVLYLRHHAAAWRMACVACRFSPDAELAVIEGFTRVFSALPEKSEAFASDGVTFRPYLLACVRQAALDRARAAGRPGGSDEPAPLAGLAPDGEVVLSSLEHHVARGALAALPERARTALWLSDVEAMTPTEVARILGGSAQEMAEVAAAARAKVKAGRAAALGDHEARADCRFTVEHLEDYDAGKLDPAEGVLVRSHLDSCPPCRMRLDELTNSAAALAAAVPAAPLLGGEAQHHWLTSAAGIHPAEHLLPPGLAAAAPVRRLPDVLRRSGRSGRTGRWGRGSAQRRSPQPVPVDLTGPADPMTAPGWTGSPGWSGSPTPSLPPAWTIPPGRTTAPPRPERRRRDRRNRRAALAVGLPAGLRRAGRTVWPAMPAAMLVVAWLGVMLALPWLMDPTTAPGPAGLALPAVQAYRPDYLPGARRAGPDTAPKSSAASGAAASVAAPPADSTDTAADTASAESEFAIGLDGAAGRATAAAATRLTAVEESPIGGTVRLVPTVAPAAPPVVVPVAAPAVVPAISPAVVPAAPVAPAAPVTVTPAVTPAVAAASAKSAKPHRKDKPHKATKAGKSTRKRSVPRSGIVSA